MTEDREELLQHYRQTRGALLSAIEGLNDALLAETPPGDWSVKDQLAHVAVWDDIRASEVTRISAGHESVWRMTSEQDEAYNVMAHELRLGLSIGQVRWELETSRQRPVGRHLVSHAACARWFVVRRSGAAQPARSAAHRVD